MIICKVTLSCCADACVPTAPEKNGNWSRFGAQLNHHHARLGGLYYMRRIVMFKFIL